jgi:hypothetical protein
LRSRASYASLGSMRSTPVIKPGGRLVAGLGVGVAVT